MSKRLSLYSWTWDDLNLGQRNFSNRWEDGESAERKRPSVHPKQETLSVPLPPPPELKEHKGRRAVRPRECGGML